MNWEKIKYLCGKGLWVKLKGKSKLCKLAAIDLEEIGVPFNNAEINKLWKESQSWQRTCSNYLRDIL